MGLCVKLVQGMGFPAVAALEGCLGTPQAVVLVGGLSLGPRAPATPQLPEVVSSQLVDEETGLVAPGGRA